MVALQPFAFFPLDAEGDAFFFFAFFWVSSGGSAPGVGEGEGQNQSRVGGSWWAWVGQLNPSSGWGIRTHPGCVGRGGLAEPLPDGG